MKGIVYFKDGHTEGITSWFMFTDGIDFETVSGEYWYEQGTEYMGDQFFTYNRDTLFFQPIDFIDHIELFDGGDTYGDPF